MGEWKECLLSDLGTIVGGATPSTKNPENYDNGSIAWITPKDLSDFRGRFISRGERLITKAGLNSCSTQLMPKNSVLFSSVSIRSSICANLEDTDFNFSYSAGETAVVESKSMATYFDVAVSRSSSRSSRLPSSVDLFAWKILFLMLFRRSRCFFDRAFSRFICHVVRLSEE